MTTINNTGNGLSGSTGSGSHVGSTSPTLVTPVLGVATATSLTFGGGVLSTYTNFGTWTPTFTFATPGNLSMAYTSQLGFYSVIGNMVTITFTLVCTPTFTTASGACSVGGLPLTSNSTAGNRAIGAAYVSAITTFPTTTTSPVLQVAANATTMQLFGIGPSATTNNFTATNFTTTTAITIISSLTYLT